MLGARRPVGRREIARGRRITSTRTIHMVLEIRRPLAIPPRNARCAQLQFRRASAFSPCVSHSLRLRASVVNPVASVSSDVARRHSRLNL